ncbi:MAG: hypothetical protein WD557_07315 [Dehalococcoidia bacterium]
MQLVTGSSTPSSNSTQLLTVVCPAGKVAIGGGAQVVGGNTSVALSDSRPAMVVNGRPNGWFASAFEVAAYASAWQITIHVVCADVT